MRQSRRRRGFDPRYRQFYGLFGRCQVWVRVRVRKKVHGERTEAMLEKKKNWSVFMVLRLPNPRRNKGAGVIPVALCLTYGGQVIVSLVTQDKKSYFFGLYEVSTRFFFFHASSILGSDNLFFLI